MGGKHLSNNTRKTFVHKIIKNRDDIAAKISLITYNISYILLLQISWRSLDIIILNLLIYFIWIVSLWFFLNVLSELPLDMMISLVYVYIIYSHLFNWFSGWFREGLWGKKVKGSSLRYRDDDKKVLGNSIHNFYLKFWIIFLKFLLVFIIIIIILIWIFFQ